MENEGFVIVPRSVIELIPKIGPTALAVFIVLVDHANESQECWPSIGSIATATGLTDRCVRKQLRSLEDCGVLSTEARMDGLTRQSNLYRIQTTHKPPGTKRQGALNETTLTPGTKRPHPPERSASVTRTIRTRTNELDKKGAALPVVIPDSLDCDSFKKAWAEWTQHRKEIKKRLTPSSVKKTFKELEAWGPTRAVTAIEHSIKKGWQGIFEPAGTISKIKDDKRRKREDACRYDPSRG